MSATARTLIEDATNRKLVSLASCWEIAIKAGTGKLSLGEPSCSFIEREITQNFFGLLDINLNHATWVETLPSHHRDPFDRLLIAQAICENIPIRSADRIFDAYPVTRLW